jgi:hypothetical protein
VARWTPQHLTFADPAAMRPVIAGRPVYRTMAMDRNHRLKLKPQHLLLSLPLARPQCIRTDRK